LERSAKDIELSYAVQRQIELVTESVRARYAMAIPILKGMLYSTKQEIVAQAGGYENITLEMFTRIYIEHPGDYGICFEYAVHQAVVDKSTQAYSIISDVVQRHCRIRGTTESILFGAEKAGQAHVLESAQNCLTPESRVLAGGTGQPPKLMKHIQGLKLAFYNPAYRNKLPNCISGLWKADLFLGSTGPDQWVGTTLKTNRSQLVPAKGLRIGLFPEERPGQAPRRDDVTNLILCPLPYRSDFMELFGATFQIVKHVVAAYGRMPVDGHMDPREIDASDGGHDWSRGRGRPVPGSADT
jgi:hypothetical protein